MSIQYFTFAENEPFQLSSGKTLSPVVLVYETWGKLNDKKSNAVLIFHSFSGTSHAASNSQDDPDDEGWWEEYIGPGKAFDTEKYFIICANVIGGCNGSTGPMSINPATGEPYALKFPVITIHDMVAAQEKLVRHLGIERLLSVAGGSMGGMQALEWSVAFPEISQSIICLAATHYQSAQGIAFNQVGRQAIYQDQNWNKGDYYGKTPPSMGLALARMIGFITYLSERKMHEKFGRKLQEKDALSFAFESEFQVETYLRHQGVKFVARFDANAYLYLTKAIDYFDLKLDYGAENSCGRF